MLDIELLKKAVESGNPALRPVYQQLLDRELAKKVPVVEIETITEQVPELTPAFICPKCGKVSKSNAGLASHLRNCKV